MKQVFEYTILIILFTIQAILGSFQISANLEITAAREFHANAIEVIQASAFDNEVIAETIQLATTEDHPEWRLEVKDVSVYDDRKDMKVTLYYKISPIPFVEDENFRTVIGYAR